MNDEPKQKLETPGINDRITLVGRTGSGKTVAAEFHLSRAPFDEIPYTIVDTKGEESFTHISLLAELDLLEDPPAPEKPGLYVVRPRPGFAEDEEALERYFTRVYANGNHGLFIDEGYVVFPARTRGPLVSIFTQGRTRKTPVIMNSQRPSWIGREAISEATFFQVFDLTSRKDRDTLRDFIPEKLANLEDEIPDYHSIYYDVKRKRVERLPPVRTSEASIAVINRRLEALHKEQTEVRQLDAVHEERLKEKFTRI